jgi:hypothetical protein
MHTQNEGKSAEWLATASSDIDVVANRYFWYRGRNAEVIGNPSIVHVVELKRRWLAVSALLPKRYNTLKSLR